MKFANLVLQSPILRSRHDLFPSAGRGQAALRHQPTPGEQLVCGNAKHKHLSNVDKIADSSDVWVIASNIPFTDTLALKPKS